MPRLTLATLLLFAPPGAAQQLVPGEALEVQLVASDPRLAGHGPSRTFEYDVAVDGTLFVWAASKNFDPILRVTDADGVLLGEDDDSGGGTTAFLQLEVGRNELPSITVAAADAGATGAVLLRASELSASDDADLATYRTLIDEANAAREAGDYGTARGMAAEAVEHLLARPETEQGAEWLELLHSSGSTAYYAEDARTANSAWEKLYEVRLAVLPDEHPDLQLARDNLAKALYTSGNLAGARALQENVLEVDSRTLPDEHPYLQKSRGNLAATLYTLGDLAGARALFEKVLEVFSRTLPDEHRDLQAARLNLASALYQIGDLAGAQALFEKVLEVFSRTLPDEHRDLQRARQNLASALYLIGDLVRARALEEKSLEVFSRTLPDEHPDLQGARGNLAVTLATLGDFAGARALFEKSLDVLSRTLPDEHPELQLARGNLAATLVLFGDFAGAGALQEKVLEVDSRTLPDEHPALQGARGNLAGTLATLGDFAGARALFEKALDVRSRTLPDEHPDLQKTRLNLAAMLYTLGDHAGARALSEEVLGVFSRTLPDEHPDPRAARQNLTLTIAAIAIKGRAGLEQRSGAEEEAERVKFTDLSRGLTNGLACAARATLLSAASREAEERCARLLPEVGFAMSSATGLGAFPANVELERKAFTVGETTRSAALVSARLTWLSRTDGDCATLRTEMRGASEEVARLVQSGSQSDEFAAAMARRDAAERKLVARARELSGGRNLVDLDPAALATELSESDVLVAYRRYTRREHVNGATDTSSTESLCAYVLRSGDRFERVELGPIAAIEEAVHTWRAELSVGSDSRGVAVGAPQSPMSGATTRGSALRKKIFDAVVPALVGAQRIVVVLDDVLHLVPLNALPLDESSLVGDRYRIETRATLTELFQQPEPLNETGQLLAFGDVEYGAPTISDEAGTTSDVAAVDVTPRAAEDAGILRGGAWSGGFASLPGTGVEVRGIARCFSDQFGAGAASELCEHAGATRERLLALAPNARWLHIATHGWFAPESIKSWSDMEPLDKQSRLALRMSGEERVRGMSPMLLCGLALAGANLPEDAVCRVPGLITADELSTLDLTNCELVVLSACDTNVGERRAGQGVASLQKALQMAGARSVITSLWKVPDEATKELMLDFYRRLWVEKKPKWQALWEAKMKLRNANGADGRPLYSTRDWAAWVLTGEPD